MLYLDMAAELPQALPPLASRVKAALGAVSEHSPERVVFLVQLL